MAVSGKRTGCSQDTDDVGPPEEKIFKADTLIYIIKTKISSAHLNHLKKVAVKNRIAVSEEFNDDITHIVANVTSYDRVLLALKRTSLPDIMEVVTMEWLTDTFTEGVPVPVSNRYRLLKTTRLSSTEQVKIEDKKCLITEYECQRPTLLEHANLPITDGLELLEKYYQHLDYKQGDTRALAFRQASCTIKALPRKITSVSEVAHLHRIGKHSMSVIEEIVENGCSKEIEGIRKDEWFQCIRVGTTVYGCGTATADKWFKEGLRTIEDVKTHRDLRLTETQKLGLAYFKSLSKPIPRAEVSSIVEIIKKEVHLCCSGASVEAVGGYRRGKPESHDVDLLLSHKDGAVAQNLLQTVLKHLRTKGMVIHADVLVGQNTQSFAQNTHTLSSQQSYNSQGKQRRVKFDHLDKAYCILKFNAEKDLLTSTASETSAASGSDDDDVVRRVDLIVSPPEQYPFALVSWTGSKQFNRSLRRYAVKECQKTVTAHGIFDIVERKFLKAESERDIFDILKLDYLEPYQRNC